MICLVTASFSFVLFNSNDFGLVRYALPIHTLAICGTLGSWRRPSSGIRSWKVFVFDLENDKNNCSAIYNDTTDLPSNDYTRVSICAGHGTWAWCGVTPVPLPPHTSETWWGVPYYCLCSNSSCAPEKEKGVSTDIISQVRSSNILIWRGSFSSRLSLPFYHSSVAPCRSSQALVTHNWYQNVAYKMFVQRGAITPHIQVLWRTVSE